MRTLLTLLLLLPLFVWAQPKEKKEPQLTEKLTVTHMQFNPQEKVYRVSFIEKAAPLTAPQEMGRCLQQSIQNKKMVEVSFMAFKMQMTSCKVLP